MTIAFILFLVTLIVAIPLRIWQFATLIDQSTGFFNEVNSSVWGFLILLLGSALLMAIFTVKDKNTMDYPYRNGAKGIGFVVFLSGIVAIISAVKGVWILPGGETPFVGSVILYIFGVSSVILGILLVVNKTQNTFIRFLLFIPLIWSLIRVWSIYLGEKPILTVSQHLLELLGYVNLILFFMAFAYCVSGFGQPKHGKRVVFFGFLASILLLTVSVPQLLFSFIDEGKKISDEVFFTQLLNLVCAIVSGVAPLYVCFGTDPLLDYHSLYERESAADDPTIRGKSNIPVGPAVPAPGTDLHSGFTTLMEGVDVSLWEQNVPMQADSVDEGYRYTYDSTFDEEEDLTAKKFVVPEKAFYTNPNFRDVKYEELFEESGAEKRVLETSSEPNRIEPNSSSSED